MAVCMSVANGHSVALRIEKTGFWQFSHFLLQSLFVQYKGSRRASRAGQQRRPVVFCFVQTAL